ncbi:roadblock/LC7 domain-containing protein [Streptomyces sp. p1417]|uniref:Roadblock/LC7 domain-containing protein n=1 Tax=Streptomyces typhae TaxID=2681492 RepID=A0A6L6X8P2_9ACTN|nr:roadblock/LC7 domain-containing protein [Streptomyces typhae]MVO90224.1 roadblock/LC7 domain-containing protein [Streptomyces typhae]
MSTHSPTHDVSDAVPAEASAAGPQEAMAWLLRQFAIDVSGVTHAVLLSRDGLRLLDSDVDKDWADELSAAVSGMASIASNITGPRNETHPATQIMIEREDCLVFVQNAGRAAAVEGYPGTDGFVDTVLAAIATPDADAGRVGFEMGRLIGRFERYMLVPVRVSAGDVR